jgi:hypothetical protein
VGATTGTHRLAVLGALAALTTAACETEPSVAQLVLRVEPEVAARLVSVQVMVTATAPTAAGENVICTPCTRVFTPADHDFTRPLVIDFIRGNPRYKVAWFIINYDTGGAQPGRLYHWINFPESGVASSATVITASCLDAVCLDEALDCLVGPECRDPNLPVVVRDRLWGSVPCATDCNLPEPDADADADADVVADSDVDTVVDSDAGADGDTEASDTGEVSPDDGGA